MFSFDVVEQGHELVRMYAVEVFPLFLRFNVRWDLEF